MPGLGRPQQIILMTALWAGTLIFIDHKLNVHPERAKAATLATNPQITMTLNHFCCGGCYEDLFAALKSNSWLSNPVVLDKNLPSQAEANMHAAMTPGSSMQSANDYSGTAQANIDKNQIGMVDLAKVEAAVAAKGLVDRSFILSGIPHFRLIYILPHFCCQMCSDAVKSEFAPSKLNPIAPAMTELNLTNIPLVSTVDHSVTLEYRDKADVGATIAVLRKVGFMPLSIRVQVMN